MRQPIDPKKLRRIANILDEEADIVASSYDTTIGRTERQVQASPVIKDYREARRFKEYRRLARDMRKAAG